MSALARFLHQQGYQVSGYDRVRSRLCEKLEEEGLKINYDDIIDSVVELDRNDTLVVYTPAIPSTSQTTFLLQKRRV